MLASVTPLFHGEGGIWDEILCLVPSLLLVALIVYVYFRERRTQTNDPERSPTPKDSNDPPPTES